MRIKYLFTILITLVILSVKAQNKNLSKQQIQEDLEFLKNSLNENSSYVYLNGYDFNIDFKTYIETIGDSTQLEDFGFFLTEAIGKIGDRHSSVKGYGNETLFLPFMYAPENNKVLVLNSNQNKEFEILHSNYPYLKSIDGIDITDFLHKTRPEDIKAPSQTYFTRAVRDLRDIQKNYKILHKELPKEIRLTLSDATLENDTILVVSTVERSGRLRPWDEKFKSKYARVKDEDYNKPEIIEQLFKVEDNIGYIKLPEMANIDEAPLLYDKVNSFMKSIKNSTALIIDVRSNGGGTRDLMYEFAKYLIHPDSIYVINATKQRGTLPLSKESIENLNTRFLYAMSELDTKEQAKATAFLKTFTPMYDLDTEKYSEYYFGLFNGNKLSQNSFYYNKPVYILANEKTFSAASVFVSAFKGIPNIQIVGVTTDGSSGNSDWFDLPNSKLFGKISTMVSFQKDGKTLDGYGTKPDIKIARDLEQILWKDDTQLEKLKTLILEKH